MRMIGEFLRMNLIWPVADMVMGTCTMKWYKQIERMNKWTKEEVRQWQTEQLHKIVHHAYNHTRYYHDVMEKMGLRPEDIKSMEDIKLLPVLTREDIKNHFNDIIPDNIRQYRHRHCSTGGSTGQPMHYICDENTWGFVTAMKIYSWRKTGYRYGDKFVSLGSSSLFPVNKKSLVHEIYYRLRNTIPLNGMNMDDDTCATYMDIVRKHKVRYIYGYATAIYLLARYCKEHNVQWHFNAAFSTAEKLTPEYRQTIADTWGAIVMDCYGSRDGCITAYELSNGHYHVGYASWFEASEKEPSELYATNLIGYAFPTIRYSNRDEVMMWSESIESSYNGQLMMEIIGRTSDVMVFDNGHKLTTPGFTIMLRNFNVEAYRITQNGGMSILVQIQKRDSYTIDEHNLLYATLKKYVGEEVSVVIEYVDGFTPLKNGKRSFFLNDNSRINE